MFHASAVPVYVNFSNLQEKSWYEISSLGFVLKKKIKPEDKKEKSVQNITIWISSNNIIVDVFIEISMHTATYKSICINGSLLLANL